MRAWSRESFERLVLVLDMVLLMSASEEGLTGSPEDCYLLALAALRVAQLRSEIARPVVTAEVKHAVHVSLGLDSAGAPPAPPTMPAPPPVPLRPAPPPRPPSPPTSGTFDWLAEHLRNAVKDLSREAGLDTNDSGQQLGVASTLVHLSLEVARRSLNARAFCGVVLRRLRGHMGAQTVLAAIRDVELAAEPPAQPPPGDPGPWGWN